MFGIPVALLIRIGIAIAIAAALAWAWHLFVDHYREQGRAEVRKEWDAEKLAQAKEQHRREENAERAKQEAERQAVLRERARAARFSKLDPAGAAAANPIALSARDVELFNAGRRAAEASRPADEPVQTAPAASESTQAFVIALQEWAGGCIDRVAAWAAFYRDQQTAFAGGKP